MLKRIELEGAAGFVGKLNRCRHFLLLGAACAGAWMTLLTPTVLAQASAAPATSATASLTPAFDVVSIRPHEGTLRLGGGGYRDQPDGMTGTVSVSMLVMNAYDLRTADQLSGAPAWAQNDWFDIKAKMSDADVAAMRTLSPAESKARRQQMLQALLAERFQLKSRSEIKQVPVYNLVVTKDSSKLIDSSTDPNPPLGKGEDGKPHQGTKFLKDTSIWQAWSMENLATFLCNPGFAIGRPVVNMTGLTSTYDFPLNWSVYSRSVRSAPEGGASDPADEGTFLIPALKELGLNLRPATGGVEYVVIEHVEKPSEN